MSSKYNGQHKVSIRGVPWWEKPSDFQRFTRLRKSVQLRASFRYILVTQLREGYRRINEQAPRCGPLVDVDKHARFSNFPSSVV